jgi:methionyl-tRNA synthetase
MPKTVFAHGWWLVGRDKMSKSTGNVVNPMDMADRYGVDPFRYFLMAEMSLGQDASFTEEAFVRRYNADLANDLGNILSRVMRLVTDYCEGAIPEPGAPGPDEEVLRQVAVSAAEGMAESVSRMRLDQGLAGLAAAVRAANQYLEKRQPWTLAKTGEREQLRTVLYTAAETLRIVSGMLYPVMPGKMTELRAALGAPAGAPDFGELRKWGRLLPGARIGKLGSLFPRIAAEKKAADGTETSKPGPVPAPPAAAADKKPAAEGVATIEYADFQKLRLLTAKVVGAQRVQGADKLLCLQIEVGADKRQIVAGIALHYAPEQLIGKNIVLVSNLKPAKIRGVESNGMLLAASNGDQLKLVTLDGDLPSGSLVK